jgi:hypothetical protein
MPEMPKSMISARQDWDCEAALERRAIDVSCEITRLRVELEWISNLLKRCCYGKENSEIDDRATCANGDAR